MNPRALPAVFLSVLLGVCALVVASAAQSVQSTSSDVASPKAGITITVDELASLLQRRDTPRVRIENKYGGTVTGKAVGVDPSGKSVSVDVSAEAVGVGGILTVDVPLITSIEVLVPLTPEEVQRAEKATAAYIAALRAPSPGADDDTLGSTDAVLAKPEAVMSTDAVVSPPAVPADSILEKYPPAQGWGPDRFAEIVRKAVVLGLQPFGKDKTFLTDYDAWKTAYNKRRELQLEELAAMKRADRKVPADFELWPELAPVPSLEGAPVSAIPDTPVGDSSDEAPVGAPSDPTGQ